MKKMMAFVFALTCMLSLASCGGRGKSHTIEFTIPAGYNDAFEFSDEAIFPMHLFVRKKKSHQKERLLQLRRAQDILQFLSF